MSVAQTLPVAPVAPGMNARPKYTVKFYSGSYRERQDAANDDCAICFVAHHLNSAGSPNADYALCDVATNASEKSKAWAGWYVAQVADAFNIKVWGVDGVCVGGMGGRGNSQIFYTDMPAILPEPLFVSNPTRAESLRVDESWLGSECARDILARILAGSIRKYFPQGGLVAFSIGHKDNPANPGDLGAKVYGDPPLYEAEITADILNRAAKMLEG